VEKLTREMLMDILKKDSFCVITPTDSKNCYSAVGIFMFQAREK
jgi:hypothetical protein